MIRYFNHANKLSINLGGVDINLDETVKMELKYKYILVQKNFAAHANLYHLSCLLKLTE